MKTVLSLAAAVALLVSTAWTKPAHADGGAIALAIVAGVVTVASIKCAAKDGDETLCWLSPLAYLGAAHAMVAPAPKGNITVRAVKRKKKM